MGRPWEYPRWRRVLMQVVMWLIFGASLGLAQLISAHHRNAGETFGTLVQVDRFLVRLPDDWTMVPHHDVDADGVQAVDPSTNRRLFVLVMKLPSLPGLNGPGMSAKPKPGQGVDFTGLQQTGTMSIDRQYQDLQGKRVVTRTITAAASVPPNEVIMITLRLPTDAQAGRADARLVRDIAAGITAIPPDSHTDDDEDSGT